MKHEEPEKSKGGRKSVEDYEFAEKIAGGKKRSFGMDDYFSCKSGDDSK